jgi:hypothetical protein
MTESILNPTADMPLYVPDMSKPLRERTAHVVSSLVQGEKQLVPKWTPELRQHLKQMLDLYDDELELVQKQIESGNIHRNTSLGNSISFTVT